MTHRLATNLIIRDNNNCDLEILIDQYSGLIIPADLWKVVSHIQCCQMGNMTVLYERLKQIDRGKWLSVYVVSISCVWVYILCKRSVETHSEGIIDLTTNQIFPIQDSSYVCIETFAWTKTEWKKNNVLRFTLKVRSKTSTPEEWRKKWKKKKRFLSFFIFFLVATIPENTLKDWSLNAAEKLVGWICASTGSLASPPSPPPPPPSPVLHVWRALPAGHRVTFGWLTEGGSRKSTGAKVDVHESRRTRS